MSSTLKLLAGMTLGAIIMTNTVSQAQEYTLSADPTAAVITMDNQGDRLKRIDDSPTISILADGTIIMPQSYSHSLAYQGQISAEDLQQLLGFIIEQNQFFN